MSNLPLSSEIALVTGASRGIGAAIADELAARGATVFGTATSDAGAEAIGARLAGKGGHGRRLDVTDAAAVDALIEAIGKESGPVSILVNNAGITRDNLLMRMKDEDWQAILDTNLTSVFRASKAVLRGMMKARKGRIINIASVIGVTCPISFSFGDVAMEIQPLLDKILPAMIPAAITGSAYYLLTKKNASMTALILVVIVLAMVASAAGILA